MRKRMLFITGLAATAALAVPTMAPAKDGDVLVAGTCSGASKSKLKVGPRDRGLETEFQVDSNRLGQTWSWTIKDNGTQVAAGSATTAGPSASFTVRRVLVNRAGSDRIVATATNRATGERCSATATV
jgi:hypothetical protein